MTLHVWGFSTTNWALTIRNKHNRKPSEGCGFLFDFAAICSGVELFLTISRRCKISISKNLFYAMTLSELYSINRMHEDELSEGFIIIEQKHESCFHGIITCLDSMETKIVIAECLWLISWITKLKSPNCCSSHESPPKKSITGIYISKRFKWTCREEQPVIY